MPLNNSGITETKINEMLNFGDSYIILWDENCTIVDISLAVIDFFGAQSKEMVHKRYDELSPKHQPDDRLSTAAMPEWIRYTFENGNATFEWLFKRLDGRHMDCHIELQRTQYFGQKIVCAFISERFSTIDTEVQKAETSVSTTMRETDIDLEFTRQMSAERVVQQRLQAMLDSSPLCTFIMDETFNVVDCNHLAVSLFEFNDKQHFIESVFQVAHRYQDEAGAGMMVLEKIQLAFKEGYSQFEWTARTLSEKQVPVEFTVERVALEEKYFVIIYVRDMTEFYRQKEAEISERKKLQTMLDSTPLACCISDKNFVVTDCNQVTVNLFGLKDKEQYIKDFYDLSPEYQPDGTASKSKMAEIYQEVLANGESHFEWMHCTLDGDLIPCKITLKQLTLDGETIKVGYIQDLREYKAMTAQLEEAVYALKNRERLLAVVNQVATMLLTVGNKDSLESTIMQSMEIISLCLDADRMNLHRVIMDEESMNIIPIHEWLSELGMRTPQIDMNVTLPLDTMGELGKLLLSGECFNGPVSDLPEADQSFLNPYNALKSIVVIPLLFDGQPWGILSIDDCKNERTLPSEEMDILRSASLMISSVHRRAEQEAEMHRIEIAEESNREKSRFLAKISHEIRTPLTAILGISEIQLQTPGSFPHIEESFAKIHNSANILIGIINDILDHSKIEAGKMEISQSEYEVASIISDVAYQHLFYLEDKDIKFLISVDETLPAYLIGDAIRIEQVIGNLLSNAFKYTVSGTVELSFESAADESKSGNVTFVITVRDTGLGMTREQLEKLYNEYERFHMNEISSVTGTGLGMSITYGLLQMMDGKIHIESEVGKGTTVVVCIPQSLASSEVLGKEVATRLQQFEEHTHIATKRFNFEPEPMPYGKVLIVDDVEANLYVASGLLSFYDLNIETCESGQDSIYKIKQGNVYDIIFMDHMMPGLDGLETMHIMRNMGYTHPIVALTANALVGQAEMFIESGFNGFISKPIQTKQLDAILTKHIRDKQSPEVIEAAKAAKNKKQNDKNASPKNIDGYFDGEELKQKLRSEFVKVQKNASANIGNAIDTGDIKTAHRLAHSLKGAAALIGEDALVKLAENAECSLKDNIAPSEIQLSEMATEITRILEAISKIESVGKTKDIDVSDAKVLDIKKAMRLFDDLSPLLSTFNVKCLDLLGELRNIPETAVLCKQIEDFDFKFASNTLSTLIAIFDTIEDRSARVE